MVTLEGAPAGGGAGPWASPLLLGLLTQWSQRVGGPHSHPLGRALAELDAPWGTGLGLWLHSHGVRGRGACQAGTRVLRSPASLLGASVPPARLRFSEDPRLLRVLKTVSGTEFSAEPRTLTHRVPVPVCLFTALGDPAGRGYPTGGPVEVSLQVLDGPCHSGLAVCSWVLVWTLCF